MKKTVCLWLSVVYFWKISPLQQNYCLHKAVYNENNHLTLLCKNISTNVETSLPSCILQMSMVHNQHLKTKLGEKLNLPLIDDHRLWNSVLGNQKVKKQKSNVVRTFESDPCTLSVCVWLVLSILKSYFILFPRNFVSLEQNVNSLTEIRENCPINVCDLPALPELFVAGIRIAKSVSLWVLKLPSVMFSILTFLQSLK